MSNLVWFALLGLPVLVAIALWTTRPSRKPVAEAPADYPVLLFRNRVLEDASPPALAALPVVVGMHDWDDLRDLLSDRYPEFPPFPDMETTRQLVVSGALPGDSKIRIERAGQAIRVVFADDTHSELPMPLDDDGGAEISTLREFSLALPYPAWRLDAAGRVTWTNAAYDALRTRLKNPPTNEAAPLIDGEMSDGTRVKIDVTDKPNPEWYAVTRRSIGDDIFFFTTCQTDLVAAEETRRDFVQTLAKTFAHLPIGLAIFNRDRRLVLFNPALSDLTGLKMQFLGPKPTLDSFFDAMRETRRMPEPKNYRTWRQRINDLVTAAEGDIFEETWTLENGQTLRVTGQPHPEGALAFLIEDISAEVSLTRNFRAELELGQSLLDTFDDALVVFSQTGLLTFSNKAYDDLWSFHSEGSFADVSISDALKLWRSKSPTEGAWQRIQDTVMTFGERDSFEMRIRMADSRSLLCRVVPITAGATMIRFAEPILMKIPEPMGD